MAYTRKNFRSKKELQEAVRAWLNGDGEPVTVYEPNWWGPAPREGLVYLTGPHGVSVHQWSARAILENGNVRRVD